MFKHLICCKVPDIKYLALFFVKNRLFTSVLLGTAIDVIIFNFTVLIYGNNPLTNHIFIGLGNHYRFNK